MQGRGGTWDDVRLGEFLDMFFFDMRAEARDFNW